MWYSTLAKYCLPSVSLGLLGCCLLQLIQKTFIHFTWWWICSSYSWMSMWFNNCSILWNPNIQTLIYFATGVSSWVITKFYPESLKWTRHEVVSNQWKNTKENIELIILMEEEGRIHRDWKCINLALYRRVNGTVISLPHQSAKRVASGAQVFE